MDVNVDPAAVAEAAKTTPAGSTVAGWRTTPAKAPATVAGSPAAQTPAAPAPVDPGALLAALRALTPAQLAALGLQHTGGTAAASGPPSLLTHTPQGLAAELFRGASAACGALIKAAQNSQWTTPQDIATLGDDAVNLVLEFVPGYGRDAIGQFADAVVNEAAPMASEAIHGLLSVAQVRIDALLKQAL